MHLSLVTVLSNKDCLVSNRPMRTLFVTQLHSSTTEERLRSVFEKYGPVKRTYIIAYPWKKNCGFVEFKQESACLDALVDMRFKYFPDKWKWKVCYAHTDDPGKSVEEEGLEEVDWLEELYGFPYHESHSHLSSLSVDAQGLQKQMDELLSSLGTSALTEKGVLGQLAHRFIKNLMEISGLSVREDAVGNIIGRWEGIRSELSAVATGSHIDAIPFFGTYDGVVCILCAIEAVNVLKRYSIGIVTAIEAPIRIIVEFQGNKGQNRNGAALAAMELGLAFEDENGFGCGKAIIHTGVINSIRKSNLTIDIDAYHREKSKKIYQFTSSIATKWGVILSAFRTVHPHPNPLAHSEKIVHAMKKSSKELNLSHTLMTTRAYNDSLFMSRISPVGMVFIPCFKDKSQTVEKYASEEISNGIKVLALTLAKLSLQ